MEDYYNGCIPVDKVRFVIFSNGVEDANNISTCLTPRQIEMEYNLEKYYFDSDYIEEGFFVIKRREN